MEKEYRKNKVLIIFVALLITVFCFFVMKRYISTASGIRVEINMMTEKNMNFQVFYTNEDSKNFNEVDSIRKEIDGKNEFQKVWVTLPVDKLKKLRVDLGEFPGAVKIKNIKIYGKKKIEILPKDILKFNKNQIESEEMGSDGTITLDSNSVDPYIVLDSDMIKNTQIKRVDRLQGITFIIIVFFGSYKVISYIDDKRVDISWNRLLYILFFFSIIIFPILKIDNEKKDMVENRNLAMKSSLRKNGLVNLKFGKETESWLNDHFYKRREIINIYDSINNFLLGRIENDRAVAGREDWLFYKGDASVQNFQNINPFTDEELEKIYQNLSERKGWLEKQNIRYYTFVAPDKNKIYGEYFPKYLNKINDNGKAYNLRKYVKDKDISFIYPYEELMSKKNEGLLYWKTDTHWNSFGGYIGYNRLMEEIKKDFPNLEIVKEDELNIESKPYLSGDLLNMLNLSSDKYKNTDYRTLELKEQSFKYIKNEGTKGVVTKSDKPLKVLVFRDSFTTAMTPYISETFGEVEYIWNHNFNNFQDKIKEFKPDIVIHEMVERYIGVLKNDSPKLGGEK